MEDNFEQTCKAKEGGADDAIHNRPTGLSIAITIPY